MNGIQTAMFAEWVFADTSMATDAESRLAIYPHSRRIKYSCPTLIL